MKIRFEKCFSSRLFQSVFPHIMSFFVFICGAWLLLSGAIPISHTHIEWLKKTLPLGLFETSHFLSSLFGLGLLFLGRYLQERIYAAYVLTLTLLGGGSIFSFIKGAHPLQISALSIIFVLLLLSKSYYYRKSRLSENLFTKEWFIAIAVVVICTFWLGMFNYQHVEYSHDLWWKFEFSNGASRFLRSLIGAVVFMIILALRMLFKPFHPAYVAPSVSDENDIFDIVKRSTRSSASFAYLPDKRFLFSQNRKAFIMYGIHGQSWIVLGDPVGPLEEWESLIWKFREMCDQYNVLPAFVEIGSSAFRIYLNAGLTLLKMGEEAVIPLKQFNLEDSQFKKFRYFLRKAEKQQCSFEIRSPPHSGALLQQLKTISDNWLRSKKGREKRFSLGFFDANYLQNFQLGVVRLQDEVVAFTNIYVSAQKWECEADLMRYDIEKSPKYIMEYLFIKTILWAKENDIHRFSLGSVLLSGFKNHELASRWHKIGSMIFSHAEHFYGFQGLRAFKEKFHPIWEDKYMACSSGSAAVRILLDMTYLVSGKNFL